MPIASAYEEVTIHARFLCYLCVTILGSTWYGICMWGCEDSSKAVNCNTDWDFSLGSVVPENIFN